MGLTNDHRLVLLGLLELDRGHADDDPERYKPKAFFPIAEHLRALDPDVVFVVGPRGAGKSKMVEAIADEESRKALVRILGGQLPKSAGAWPRGYPYRTLGPSHRAWEEFAKKEPLSDRIQTLWLGILVRVLKDQLPSEERIGLKTIFEVSGSDAEALYDATKEAIPLVERCLDALEERLLREERYIFVTYDELDTLYYQDWASTLQVLRGLTALWAGYYRRWRRLRAKIFVRTDLYEEQSGMMSSDSAKMAARRVELYWSDRNLYGALFKQIVNRSRDLREYFISSIKLDDDKTFGWIPRFNHDKDARPAVERLCGAFMGANANKGHTVNWLTNAIRDGAGRVSPRNLTQLVEFGAKIERAKLRPVKKKPQLLHHISLRNALTEVSKQHVQVASQSEQPWLVGLERRLHETGGREVPWMRKDLERYLAHRWEDPWADAEDRPRPPALSPKELVDRLLRLGVFRERERYNTRSDVAIDVPDLYLEGLKLKRRGGVARD